MGTAADITLSNKTAVFRLMDILGSARSDSTMHPTELKDATRAKKESGLLSFLIKSCFGVSLIREIAVRLADDIARFRADDDIRMHHTNLDLTAFAKLADLVRIVADRVLLAKLLGDPRECRVHVIHRL